MMPPTQHRREARDLARSQRLCRLVDRAVTVAESRQRLVRRLGGAGALPEPLADRPRLVKARAYEPRCPYRSESWLVEGPGCQGDGVVLGSSRLPSTALSSAPTNSAKLDP